MQDGVKVSKCSLCGVEKRQTIGALGHDWKTDVTSQPNCTQPAKCRVCGETDGSALGHSVGSGNTCTRCGESVMVDMRDRIGAPVDDPSVVAGGRLPSNKVAFAFAPMNDMYMKFCWSAKNNSGKTIKYYTVTFEFHNRVGDLILTKNSQKMVGPIAPGEMISIRNWFTLYKAVFHTFCLVTITMI